MLYIHFRMWWLQVKGTFSWKQLIIFYCSKWHVKWLSKCSSLFRNVFLLLLLVVLVLRRFALPCYRVWGHRMTQSLSALDLRFCLYLPSLWEFSKTLIEEASHATSNAFSYENINMLKLKIETISDVFKLFFDWNKNYFLIIGIRYVIFE